MTRTRRAVLAAGAMAAGAMIAAACSGDTGTISLRLVTAPESEVLDQVVRARLTLSEPPAVVEATRDEQGSLTLDLDVPAGNRPGVLTFEGFDQDGARVAFGRSGLLPIAAATVEVSLYVAAPMSMAATPAPLSPARADMAVAALPYGALVAGGRTGASATEGASDEVAIYSVHTHAFQPRAPLPEARIATAAAAGAFGAVYLVGGLGPDGAPRRDAFAFRPAVAPDGAYIPLAVDDGDGDGDGGVLPRAGAAMAPLGQETFVVTGAPLALVNGAGGRVVAMAGAPALAGTATTAVAGDTAHVLFAGAGSGESGAVVLAGGRFTTLAPPNDGGDGDGAASMLRTGHGAVRLPDESILVVGGAIDLPDGPVLAAAARFQPMAQTLARVDLLATRRSHAAVAATDEHLVVAGGVDVAGALIGDVEVFDARTLEPAAVLPMVVPRRGAAAVALANGQVLVVGGVDQSGAPVGTAELFTPAP